MKIILLKNVPKVGQKGEVKDLKEGYVRNLLLPKGLAKIATKEELNNLNFRNQKEKEAEEAQIGKTAEILNKIDGQTFNIKENANEKGHLFAKVGKGEVIKAVKNQSGLEIKENWFDLEPIKEVGEYKINLSFEKLDKTITIAIN